MSEDRVKELLRELLLEVEKDPQLDAEALGQVQKFANGLNEKFDPEVDADNDTLLDDAIALEASFAANHPVAERIIQELVNNLSKIGI